MTTALTTRVSTDTTYAPTVKGSPLSSAEIDNNFISLATNKIETSVMDTAATANKLVLRDSSGNINVASITATGITISGGSGVPTSSGGTGQVTYSSGQILIGNSGGTLTKTTLTGTANQVTVTNGSGSITLSTPQDLASSSNVQFGSIGVGTTGSGTSGEIRAVATITAYYSDDRLKTRKGNIKNALEKVLSLDGFYYEANETAQALGYKPTPEVGLSAQQVQAVLPEVVVPAPIDEKYLTIHYERVIPLLVEAIKELHKEIKQLKGE
jgi:hypothetical protein